MLQKSVTIIQIGGTARANSFCHSDVKLYYCIVFYKFASMYKSSFCALHVIFKPSNPMWQICRAMSHWAMQNRVSDSLDTFRVTVMCSVPQGSLFFIMYMADLADRAASTASLFMPMQTTHSCTCTSVATKWRNPPISSSTASLTSATGCSPTD